MTEQAVKARVRKITQWSPIWIVPVVAVLIGAWMLVYTYKNQGPTLTLLASNAEGIIPGKTAIKSRSVDVGKVFSVELSQDLKQVVIKARMNPGSDALLNDESQLWVVKPSVGRGGVTGLNTLLSGAYIELQPGKGSTDKFYYELLDSPPIAPPDAPGVRVFLTSGDATSLSVGDPVLYRGYDVGTVELGEFDTAGRSMRYQLFIRAPYDALVTENVRFWQSSGMALDMSAEGVRIEMGSIATLLSGGVTFDVLDGWPVGAQAANNSKFQLFENKKSIQDGLYNEYLEYLLFFDESVRGLTSGAPVEYRGVRIGTVMTVPYFFNMKNPLQIAFNRGIPVLIRVEAGRLYDSLTLPQLQTELDQAVQQGLRAVLKTGNLLTGGLYIDLNIIEDAPTQAPADVVADVAAVAASDAAGTSAAVVNAVTNPTAASGAEAVVTAIADAASEATDAAAANVQITPLATPELDQFAGYKILPTARSGLGHIEQKVLQALDKINNLPVEQVLADSSATLNETKQLMLESQQLVKSLDALVGKDSTQALPAEVQQSLLEMRKTLNGFSAGSPVYERINSNLQAMDKVLRDLQPVVQTLNQQSNALILGADPKTDPEPKQGVKP
ncbi:paraquat-inducible protein B [Rheinheimera sp. SA_1]|uniref:intermembrane transport protein PqiB n=1 Tax=Rheinheimera sp. SA_1 TaxID=1827365 RepID=UPI0007FEEAD6|nr:intermembrane transport protein PqiB [Rheinheimera sp. SA_1]OBP13993.1 paraquat-inducible protein B [Rheinheimera sp. SA_1]